MARGPDFDRYKNAILDCLSRSDISDLEVQCSDGNIKVPGLVLASVCCFFSCVEPRSLEDCYLILPDLTREKVAALVLGRSSCLTLSWRIFTVTPAEDI